MGKNERKDGSRSGGQGRSVLVSKSLSRLLRHQAQAEKVPITSEGWVRVDHLLAWKGLSKFNPVVNLDEIFSLVEENDKKRFGLRYLKDGSRSESLNGADANEQGLESIQEATTVIDLESDQNDATTEFTTKRALEVLRSGDDVDPSHFVIRATQGHSMKEVETEGLLIPINLEDPSSIPEVVVHGTFYGAWSSILQDGGLKKMNRNMVHFASGPTLREVLPDHDHHTDEKVNEALKENKVISGMRSDAQILIYVDIRRCLENIKERGLDMKWWRSENGVILTEGIELNTNETISQTTPDGTNAGESQSEEAKRKAKWREGNRVERIVPMEYWEVAVEIKSGLGVLWRQGEGIVKELPLHLQNKGMPRGKERGSRGRVRGRK